MSFHHEVLGLVKSRAKSSRLSQYVPIDGLYRVETYTCPDYHGEPVTCDGAGDGVSAFSIDLPWTGYDPSADYFAVIVHITGPRTNAPGGCHQSFPSLPDPCGGVGGDFPVYDGTLAPSDWVRQVIEQSGPPPWNATSEQAVPNTFNATGSAETNWLAFTYWPDRTEVPDMARAESAYLVNNAPDWPIPDAAGNTFGNCLFTAAQLPASIDLALTHHNRDMDYPGRLYAFVQAYVLGDPVVPEGVHGVYVHGA